MANETKFIDMFEQFHGTFYDYEQKLRFFISDQWVLKFFRSWGSSPSLAILTLFSPVGPSY